MLAPAGATRHIHKHVWPEPAKGTRTQPGSPPLAHTRREGWSQLQADLTQGPPNTHIAHAIIFCRLYINDLLLFLNLDITFLFSHGDQGWFK